MKKYYTDKIAMTDRITKLISMIYDSVPQVEADRAKLITESYKETEGLPMVLRRAKAFEKILHQLPIVIRDGELIVGNLTKAPFSTQIFPEFSNDWIEQEFDRISKRTGDVFQITEENKKELSESFQYWKGKTVNELAASYMCPETKQAIGHGIFTVGNYWFNGIGHISVDYEKVLKKGFAGIRSEAVKKLEEGDCTSPEFLEKRAFYQAVVIVMDAGIHFANRFARLAEDMAGKESDGKRREELKQIAVNCSKVPEKPAENFYEACQLFWFVQLLIQLESNGHSISPMRFDQYMYPYYERDIRNGLLSRETAQEILDCLWVKLNDINKIRDEESTKGFGGYPMFQNLIVGGQHPDGGDATNDLSFACLEATAHIKMAQPSISIRVWNNTPDSLLRKAAEVTRLGLGMPAYYNDEVIIPAMVNRGVSLEDARDYGIIGCVEPQKGGKTEGWHDAAFFNIAKVLEVTLNNGMDGGEQIGPKTGDWTRFESFEELMEAYKKQMEYFVKLLVNADNAVDLAHASRVPLPFVSSMVYDCLGRGKTINEGGAYYNFTGPQGVGVADVADSLSAIKYLVYDTKKVDAEEYQRAIRNNFGDGLPEQPVRKVPRELIERVIRKLTAKGERLTEEQLTELLNLDIPMPDLHGGKTDNGDYSRLLTYISECPRYGNDHDDADQIAHDAAMIYCREVEKYQNPRGGKFQPGLYPVSANVPMGGQTGALPDGRKAGLPIADGVSPCSGHDKNGPTAVANSVAKLNHSIASNGTLLNQKFHPSALEGDKGLDKLSALIRGYFDQKGMHVQYNVISREKLLDAQKNPDKYRDMIVRVAGYSAVFVSLDKSLQDDIIARTEQMF